MVLAAAVIVGLAAGMARAWIGKRPYQVVSLRFPGLVLFAFIPQWMAFYQSRTGTRVPDEWVPAVLVGSQIFLLVFAWINRKQPGFWLLGLGLALNFTVIVLNGGMMPIRPEAAQKLYEGVPGSTWEVGKRLGGGKDVVLRPEDTHLWFLSDWFLLPDWFRFQVAFSIGDVLIALGAFWLLWSLGGASDKADVSRG